MTRLGIWRDCLIILNNFAEVTKSIYKGLYAFCILRSMVKVVREGKFKSKTTNQTVIILEKLNKKKE